MKTATIVLLVVLLAACQEQDDWERLLECGDLSAGDEAVILQDLGDMQAELDEWKAKDLSRKPDAIECEADWSSCRAVFYAPMTGSSLMFTACTGSNGKWLCVERWAKTR